nr:hypothetical protein [Candidatus Magasanikbacteria bacterium]
MPSGFKAGAELPELVLLPELFELGAECDVEEGFAGLLVFGNKADKETDVLGVLTEGEVRAGLFGCKVGGVVGKVGLI